MKMDISVCASILAAALVIAAAIYFRPAAMDPAGSKQAFYGNGHVYIVDLQKGEIANIIPGKP
jgi:hypothetical protein